MEFSCHTWGFNDLTLPEALGIIARLGFRYADIGTGPHLNLARAANPATRAELLREMRGDLALYNLQLGDMTWMLPRISINDESKRQTDIALFKAALPFAKALGTPGITLSPGAVHPDDDEEAWDRTASALREMMAAAQKLDLALSIEPHLDSMAATPERALRLLEAVPGLRLTVDWAHLVCQKIKPEQISNLLPHARHIQVRQAAPNKLQTAFDKGRIDLNEVVQAIRTAGYSGLVCVEYMQTENWHGLQRVNALVEASRTRDALRAARDAQPA